MPLPFVTAPPEVTVEDVASGTLYFRETRDILSR